MTQCHHVFLFYKVVSYIYTKLLPKALLIQHLNEIYFPHLHNLGSKDEARGRRAFSNFNYRLGASQALRSIFMTADCL